MAAAYLHKNSHALNFDIASSPEDPNHECS